MAVAGFKENQQEKKNPLIFFDSLNCCGGRDFTNLFFPCHYSCDRITKNMKIFEVIECRNYMKKW